MRCLHPLLFFTSELNVHHWDIYFGILNLKKFILHARFEPLLTALPKPHYPVCSCLYFLHVSNHLLPWKIFYFTIPYEGYMVYRTGGVDAFKVGFFYFWLVNVYLRVSPVLMVEIVIFSGYGDP